MKGRFTFSKQTKPDTETGIYIRKAKRLNPGTRTTRLPMPDCRRISRLTVGGENAFRRIYAEGESGGTNGNRTLT